MLPHGLTPWNALPCGGPHRDHTGDFLGYETAATIDGRPSTRGAWHAQSDDIRAAVQRASARHIPRSLGSAPKDSGRTRVRPQPVPISRLHGRLNPGDGLQLLRGGVQLPHVTSGRLLQKGESLPGSSVAGIDVMETALSSGVHGAQPTAAPTSSTAIPSPPVTAYAHRSRT